MKYKAYFTKEMDISGKQILWDNDVEVIVAKGHSEEAYIQEIIEHQPDAILCRTETVTAKMMDACPGLKVVAKHGVGIDNIDVAYATKKGIQVVYAPLGNSNSVAEHAMFLLLGCARRYMHVDKIFRDGNFDERYTLHDTFELEGMTLGLIGCGRIGQILAAKAINGFGMKVLGYDPFANPDNFKVPIELLASRDELLERSDFVSLHLPSTPETVGSFDAAAFAKMKPKASFINVSRGDVVVEKDMIEALQNGRIVAAGLDVFAKEPIDYSNPLLTMPNAMLTPHTAATTEQAVVRCCTTAAQGIVEVLFGRTLTFPANKI